MNEQLIEGVRVLAPETADQLEAAVASGRPFLAPGKLADELGLPGDTPADATLPAPYRAGEHVDITELTDDQDA